MPERDRGTPPPGRPAGCPRVRGRGSTPAATTRSHTASTSSTSRCSETAAPRDVSGAATPADSNSVRHHPAPTADRELDVADPAVVHHDRIEHHLGAEHVDVPVDGAPRVGDAEVRRQLTHAGHFTSRAGACPPRPRPCRRALPRPARRATGAAPPRPVAPRPSRRPGDPSSVQWSGSDIAGMPVTFHALVQGVNAFWSAKSRAGSASSRSAPTSTGGCGEGRREDDVVRRQRGEGRRGVLPEPPDGEPELRSADGVAEAAEPAGERAEPVLPAREARARARSAPPSRSRSRRPPRAGSAPATSSTSWPRASSSREASSHAVTEDGWTSTSAMTGVMKRATRSRPGSRSQASRKLPDGSGAQNGSPTRRPASTSSSAAASRTLRARVPAVASPTGSP